MIDIQKELNALFAGEQEHNQLCSLVVAEDGICCDEHEKILDFAHLLFSRCWLTVVSKMFQQDIEDTVMQLSVTTGPWRFTERNETESHFALFGHLGFTIKIYHWLEIIRLTLEPYGVTNKFTLAQGFNLEEVSDDETSIGISHVKQILTRGFGWVETGHADRAETAVLQGNLNCSFFLLRLLHALVLEAQTRSHDSSTAALTDRIAIHDELLDRLIVLQRSSNQKCCLLVYAIVA